MTVATPTLTLTLALTLSPTLTRCANTCAGGRCPEDLCKCGAAAVGVASARPVAKGNVKPPPAAHAPDAEEDREEGGYLTRGGADEASWPAPEQEQAQQAGGDNQPAAAQAGGDDQPAAAAAAVPAAASVASPAGGDNQPASPAEVAAAAASSVLGSEQQVPSP